MSIVVTGSIAFDYLMSFPGKFTEHFLPEHMSRVSLSFLVDTMDKRRGGCAPNIAYTLALLGERPRLMATAGQDFDDYRRWLEAAGVDTSLVRRGAGQVHGVVLLQHRHRKQPDRVVLHRRDGECRRAVLSRTWTTAGSRSSRRTIPVRWCSTPRSAGRSASRSSGIPVSSARGCRAPSSRMASKAPRSSFATTTSSSCIRQKTSVDEDSVLEHTQALVITRGENGCSIYTSAGRKDVPAVPPTRIVDPTGVGDAFRAGYMKGLSHARRTRGVRAHGRRRRHLRARASRRAEPRLHLGRVPRALRGALRPDSGSGRELAAGLTCAAVTWLTLLVAAPVAMSRGRLPGLTLAVYQAGSLVCHQRPERSFHLAGVQLPVCARCFGLYLSGAVRSDAGVRATGGRSPRARRGRCWRWRRCRSR